MRCRSRFLLLLMVLLAGCALHGKVMNAQQSFNHSLDDFLQRLRWADLQGAAAHFDPPAREDFLTKFNNSKDLHITDVRLDHADYHAAEQTMDTWVVIDYYLLPSLTVKSFGFPQQWHYYPTAEYGIGEWRITSLFPAFPPAQSP